MKVTLDLKSMNTLSILKIHEALTSYLDSNELDRCLDGTYDDIASAIEQIEQQIKKGK